jgi:hypothetical protein
MKTWWLTGARTRSMRAVPARGAQPESDEEQLHMNPKSDEEQLHMKPKSDEEQLHMNIDASSQCQGESESVQNGSHVVEKGVGASPTRGTSARDLEDLVDGSAGTRSPVALPRMPSTEGGMNGSSSRTGAGQSFESYPVDGKQSFDSCPVAPVDGKQSFDSCPVATDQSFESRPRLPSKDSP